uniref:DUF3421 domain-containing protein n=1 Tax=Steinernema glaseri TaxID=37863 RepID=A0A1I7YND5_9BILA
MFTMEKHSKTEKNVAHATNAWIYFFQLTASIFHRCKTFQRCAELRRHWKPMEFSPDFPNHFRQLYHENLPRGAVVFGTEGEFIIGYDLYGCVLAWKERSMLPKIFIYNSRKKTCTPFMSILGSKKASNGEEAYLIDSTQNICQGNVTKAVEDLKDRRSTTTQETSTTTTSTTTTTTEALWSQKLVLMRNPEALVRHNRGAVGEKFRNHVVMDFKETESDKFSSVLCDKYVWKEVCVCDEVFKCSKVQLKKDYLGIRADCKAKGDCTVNAYDGDGNGAIQIAQNVHYVSCGISCLPRLEDLEKSKPIGLCTVDRKDVANKLIIDYALPLVFFHHNKPRCRYPGGEVIYYEKGTESHVPTSLFLDGGCVGTKDGKFYKAEGIYSIYHYCSEDTCTLLAVLTQGKITALEGEKIYTYDRERDCDKDKPFNDRDAYLRDIVSLMEGSCPPKTCAR